MAQHTDDTAKDAAMTKDERLAAKLRENLRRRKAQARALEANPPGAGDSGVAPANTESDLPKEGTGS